MKVKGHKNNLAIQKEYFQIVYYIFQICVLTSKSASQTKSGKVFNWFKFVCERPGEKVCRALWRYKYASAHY